MNGRIARLEASMPNVGDDWTERVLAILQALPPGSPARKAARFHVFAVAQHQRRALEAEGEPDAAAATRADRLAGVKASIAGLDDIALAEAIMRELTMVAEDHAERGACREAGCKWDEYA